MVSPRYAHPRALETLLGSLLQLARITAFYYQNLASKATDRIPEYSVGFLTWDGAGDMTIILDGFATYGGAGSSAFFKALVLIRFYEIPLNEIEVFDLDMFERFTLRAPRSSDIEYIEKGSSRQGRTKVITFVPQMTPYTVLRYVNDEIHPWEARNHPDAIVA